MLIYHNDSQTFVKWEQASMENLCTMLTNGTY